MTGLLVAIAIIVGLEIFLHLLPPASLLQYGKGLGTYYEVRDAIDILGPADIAILGSSRGRECIACPVLKTAIADKTSLDVSVANYSCPDASASEMLLVADRLLVADTHPQVILYFVSPRILLGSTVNKERDEIFGVFPDQYGGQLGTYLASLSEKPTWQVRNFLGEHFYIFKYRYRIRDWFTSLLRRRKSTSPVQGQYSIWQRYDPDRSLLNHPVSRERVQAYLQRLLDDRGRFVMGQVHLTALRKTIRLCRNAHVPLYLIAAPISKALLQAYPAELYPSFMDTMGTIVGETGVPFITLPELGVQLSDADFREQSHVNLKGATKITRAVADKVIIPVLTHEASYGHKVAPNGS